MGSQAHSPAPETTETGTHAVVPPWARSPIPVAEAHQTPKGAHASCLPVGRLRLEAVYLQVRDARGPDGYTGKRRAQRG